MGRTPLVALALLTAALAAVLLGGSLASGEPPPAPEKPPAPESVPEPQVPLQPLWDLEWRYERRYA